MSFLPLRQKVKERDRAIEQALGIRKNDPTADKLAGGNVYSPSDIEAIEREKTSYWRRRRRR